MDGIGKNRRTDGGDNAIVIENITEAVQALFGVDTHKIKVMKHN